MIEEMQNKTIKLFGQKDKLFETGPYPKPFEFNKEVADVFDDMVSRSVPLYKEVNFAIMQWAHEYIKEGSHVYDVGCSTGTTIDAIASILPFSVKFIGIDNSESMIEKAKQKLGNINKHEVQLNCEDIAKSHFNNSSMVIMNYTLQFISVRNRMAILKNICQGLNNNGILFISEKVRSECSEFQETMTSIYEHFKYDAGYSKTEIARKKEALDNVLISQTSIELQQMLLEAGFSHVETVIRWNNFTSMVAIKKC